MAPRSRLAIPTNAPLPHTHRLPPASRDVLKTLLRLSRPSLINLALEWLRDANRPFCTPFLQAYTDDQEEENAPYLSAHSIEELTEIYEELQVRKGTKREVVDRIVEGDWRHGLTLYQLAMAEAQYLFDHPTAQRWTALRLSKLKPSTSQDTTLSHTENTPTAILPRFHAPTFLNNLQREISPIVKAHYHLTRPSDPSLPLTFLRIYIHDSPYNTQRSLQSTSNKASPASRTLFLAFPDGAPYIYVSHTSSSASTSTNESHSLRKAIIDAVPKALSRTQERYKLEPTSLSTKSLPALLQMRGKDGMNCAQGGWGIFADLEACGSVLDFRRDEERREERTRRKLEEGHGEDEDKENRVEGEAQQRKRSFLGPQESPDAKRRKLVAEGRFGNSGLPDDGTGIERLDVRLDDPFPVVPVEAGAEAGAAASGRRPLRQEPSTTAGSNQVGRKLRPSLLDKSAREEDQSADGTLDKDEWIPDVRLSFQGSHVFAGLRQLVEKGVIDGKRMPGWMTGEASVSIGVVTDGRIRVKADGLV
ncbi:MAG: hypothetical protein Q9165_002143 [Trypethelium subeluteriae]